MEWKKNIATYCLRGEKVGGVDYRPVCRIYSPASARVPVGLSFMAPVIVSKCSEDAFHFIVHIHTPNSYILYCLKNLYEMTVSVWILFS